MTGPKYNLERETLLFSPDDKFSTLISKRFCKLKCSVTNCIFCFKSLFIDRGSQSFFGPS